MKLSCKIVQDLLPLYEDEVCSGESRAAVEEHLKECADCKGRLEQIKKVVVQDVAASSDNESRAAAKSFRRIRRRWAMSLLMVLLMLPVILLSVNQARGVGICYTNIGEILTAREWMQALERQDFERVFDMVDFEAAYGEIQKERETEEPDGDNTDEISFSAYYGEILNMRAEEFGSLMRERHQGKLDEYREAGFTFKSAGYQHSVLEAYSDAGGSGYWRVTYGMEVAFRGKTYSASVGMRIADGRIVQLNLENGESFPGAQMLHWVLSTYYIHEDSGLYTGVHEF